MTSLSLTRTSSARAAAVLGAMLALVLLAQPVSAACHIAAFSESEVSVDETAGEVTLTVTLLGGQPSWEGTVEFETEDGTASAPEDYTANQGTLRFESGDDRRETITIAIADDNESEGDESFTVVLSGGTGSISADDTATVTITDDDAAAPTPTETPEASPTIDDTPQALPGDDGDGFPVIAIIAIIVGVLAVAGALLARRGRATP